MSNLKGASGGNGVKGMAELLSTGGCCPDALCDGFLASLLAPCASRTEGDRNSPMERCGSYAADGATNPPDPLPGPAGALTCQVNCTDPVPPDVFFAETVT